MQTTLPERDAFEEIGVLNGCTGTDDISEYMGKVQKRVCEAGGDLVVGEVNGYGVYCRGTVFRSRAGSPTLAASTPTPVSSEAGSSSSKSTGPAGPDGVASFQFGMSLKAAESACTDAKLVWSTEENRFQCSGMPWSVGVEGAVTLNFCSNALCRIEFVTPADATGRHTMRDVLKLRELLVEKYLRPSDNRQAIPPTCQTDAIPCLLDGSAKLEYIWQFPEKRFITLVARNEPGGARVRLTYTHDVGDPKNAL